MKTRRAQKPAVLAVEAYASLLPVLEFAVRSYSVVPSSRPIIETGKHVVYISKIDHDSQNDTQLFPPPHTQAN